MNSNKTEDNELVWNLIIGVQIGCYIVLSAWIFVLHQKLNILADVQSQCKVQQTTPASPLDEFTAQARYQVKENELRQQLETNPDDPRIRKELTTLYCRQGKIPELTRMVEDHADDPEVHLALGKLYMGKKGFSEKALEHFRKMLDLAPDHPQKNHIGLRIEELQEQRGSDHVH